MADSKRYSGFQLTGLLALLGGVQLMVMGILGEYIGIIFETLRNAPRFIVFERCGFDETPVDR